MKSLIANNLAQVPNLRQVLLFYTHYDSRRTNKSTIENVKDSVAAH